MDDLTKEFFAESLEGLDQMDRCLVDLEARPHDTELLGEIFRVVHNIKGTTGFLGFPRLERLAHAGEHLLSGLRDGRFIANEEVISCLLRLADGLREILVLIEKTGNEGARREDDDAAFLALMRELDARATSGPLAAPEEVRHSAPQPVVHGSPNVATVVSSEKTLRVDVDVLNRMMNLVGELVLTRNQLLQGRVDGGTTPELARRLDAVTADLRETVMQARMQPIGHLFSKFPRMVRDLARNCEKKVRVEFSGQDTGLDRSLLEAIKDPLTHALRNAIDHGIECPAERLKASKCVQGFLSLRAFHQNGSVVIELADDGAGMSPRLLREKAAKRQLITADQASSMNDRDALQLIFLPGFSTAEAVTHVSGRGVGMDVVRANVERVGGTVEIESVEGKGTVVRLRLPLTLAIVRALIVRSAGQSFCLPQSALLELVYVPAREASEAIHCMGEAELYRLRDDLMPLVRLDRLLGLSCDGARQRTGKEEGFYLVVLESEGCRYALMVDDLRAPEEIVVKPLSPVLRDIGAFSGATVLGTGMLALILDVPALGARACVRKRSDETPRIQPETATQSPESTPFLIFEDRVGARPAERMALPLAAVERIEAFPLSDVEFANGQPLLQYRGALLPLEDRSGRLGSIVEDAAQDVTVLICHKQIAAGRTRRFGMVVERVLEVARGDLVAKDIQICTGRLAVIDKRLAIVHEDFDSVDSLREVA